MQGWRKLAEEYATAPGEDLEEIGHEWPELLDLAPDNDKAAAFEGMPDVLARRTALLGPAAGAEGVSPVLPYLEAVLERMDPEPRGEDAPYTVTVLSMINALRCCGAWSATGGGDDARERRWLGAAGRSAGRHSGRAGGRAHVALAAAGAGLTAVAITAAGDAARPFDPEADYGYDLAEFAAHLAGAQQAGAGSEGVGPAWRSFLVHFPGGLETGIVQWLDLLWAARAVYSVLGGASAGEVGAKLHREVLG